MLLLHCTPPAAESRQIAHFQVSLKNARRKQTSKTHIAHLSYILKAFKVYDDQLSEFLDQEYMNIII